LSFFFLPLSFAAFNPVQFMLGICFQHFPRHCDPCSERNLGCLVWEFTEFVSCSTWRMSWWEETGEGRFGPMTPLPLSPCIPDQAISQLSCLLYFQLSCFYLITHLC
jgi:hypothetical protein